MRSFISIYANREELQNRGMLQPQTSSWKLWSGTSCSWQNHSQWQVHSTEEEWCRQQISKIYLYVYTGSNSPSPDPTSMFRKQLWIAVLLPGRLICYCGMSSGVQKDRWELLSMILAKTACKWKGKLWQIANLFLLLTLRWTVTLALCLRAQEPLQL